MVPYGPTLTKTTRWYLCDAYYCPSTNCFWITCVYIYIYIYVHIYMCIYPRWVLGANLNFDNDPLCAAVRLENVLVETNHILVYTNRRVELAMVLYDREEHGHVAVIFPVTVALLQCAVNSRCARRARFNRSKKGFARALNIQMKAGGRSCIQIVRPVNI